MVDGVAGLDGVTGLGSLDDPMRQRLYGYVAEQDGLVTREQAATAMGIGRTLAAYHLDRLATAGLLTISYARPEGRSGPGAGRPAKLYRLADREVAVSTPPRAYELLARLLVESVGRDASGAVREAVHEAARETGRRVAAEVPSEGRDTLLAALHACGYQPGTNPADDAVELRNCPFHRLAQQHRDLVCGLNLSLVEGVIDGSGRPAHATLEPHPGRCCVVLRGEAAQPALVDK
jgi:predicted ArsR family transcriptional regulator